MTATKGRLEAANVYVHLVDREISCSPSFEDRLLWQQSNMFVGLYFSIYGICV